MPTQPGCSLVTLATATDVGPASALADKPGAIPKIAIDNIFFFAQLFSFRHYSSHSRSPCTIPLRKCVHEASALNGPLCSATSMRWRDTNCASPDNARKEPEKPAA